MNIGVVGAGYVGLVTAAGLASVGHRVVCMDIDPGKVDAVNDGRSFLYEPGLHPLVAQGVQAGTLRATTNVRDAVRHADAVFLCVGTPSAADGGIDLRAVRAAVRAIGDALRSREDRAVIVVKSTVVPGTTEEVIGPLVWQKAGRDRRSIGLAVNPEFLREGRAVQDFLQPDRIVIGGIDDASARTVADVYAAIPAPIRVTAPRTAETIKYASNALLALLISFSNEIGAICEGTAGVDAEDVMSALHLDRRLSPSVDGRRVVPDILQYLKAGCGFGGSCLPKDVRALAHHARSIGVDPRMLDATVRVNEDRPRALVHVLTEELGSVTDAPVAVLGLTFKPGTDDLRDSPALAVVDRLVRLGARVRAYDPAARDEARRHWAGESAVRVCASAQDACDGARAVVVTTAWPEFEHLDWPRLREAMAGDILLDGRRLLSPSAMARAGFRYRAVGCGRSERQPTSPARQ